MTEQRWDSPDETPSSREPVSARGRRTRAKLLDSGRQALAARGVNNTRVDDVVSRAGTSHGTFYLYFENIEDLLAGVIEECDAESAELLVALGAVTPGDVDGGAAVLDRMGEVRDRYGEIASPWVQPPSLASSRVGALSGQLGIDHHRSVAVLALIDRVLPELGPDHADASRRVAGLIDQVRYSPASQAVGAAV